MTTHITEATPEQLLQAGLPIQQVSLHIGDLIDDVVYEQSILQGMVQTVQYLAQSQPILEPMTAREFVDSAPVPEWIIEGLLPSPATVMIHSPPKVGKTTMLVDWLVKMQTGDEWAGREVQQTNVLYLTEEGGATMGEAFEHMDFDLDGPHRFLPSLNAKSDWTWQNILTRAGLYAREHGFNCIVIDTVGVWSSMGGIGGDNNDYGDATNLMRLARAAVHLFGITIILVHHDRKSGGGDIGYAAQCGINVSTA